MHAPSLLPLLLFSLAGFPDSAQSEPPLRVERAWVREAPPVAQVMAAYGHFCNDSDKAIVIVSVSSEGFARAEMHQSIETAASASMQRLDNVVVRPRDCVKFEPGGRHFMLIDPHRPLAAGERVALTLSFADDAEQDIEAMVLRQSDERKHPAGHDSHEH